MFWFMDGVHSPEVIPPWDATIVEYALIALSQYNTRHYVIPPALGVDIRFLNGYMYLSPVGVTDPTEIEARVPEFAERAGYYFANWDRLYEAWMAKVRALIGELETISFSPLPAARGHGGHHRGPRHRQRARPADATYHRLVDLTLKLWQHHFEFLNLGYAAYLDFFGFCKQLFPSIPDQAIAKMVAGIEVDLFRPDEELKKLARLAVELGIADRFSGSAPADSDRWPGCAATRRATSGWPRGRRPQQPVVQLLGRDRPSTTPTRCGWSTRTSRSASCATTSPRCSAASRWSGRSRPSIAERDRIVAEYTELIDTDEDRATFEEKLGLARMVFPYVENHNFYVEHWAHSVVWRKMRELGRVLVDRGVLRRRRRHVPAVRGTRCPEVLFDLYHGWAVGAPVARAEVLGRARWPRRRRHHERAAAVVAAAGPRRAAGGRHRAVHRHALGHHLGQRPGSGSAARDSRRRRAHRLRRLARRGRGTGPGHPVRGRDRRPAARARSWSPR